MNKTIKLAIVDDQLLFRQGLRALLGEFEDFEIVIDAPDGHTLINALEKREVNLDVVLLDLEMPIMCGMEATEYLRIHNPEIKIIILTEYDYESFSDTLLKKGAHEFLQKNFHIDLGYTKLRNFAGLNGSSPQENSFYYDGTYLYGMTEQGGTNNYGVIFKIMPNGTGYDTLLNFNIANGENPHGSLISDGTYLYGMTDGNIFKIMPNGTGYINMFNFGSGTDGALPLGSLISDGTCFYGMTSGGGTNTNGVVFKYCSIAGIESLVHINIQVTIYPNPTSDQFLIEANTTDKLIVDMYDVNGRHVFSANVSDKENINVATLDNGVYTLTIKTADRIINKKLVILR